MSSENLVAVQSFTTTTSHSQSNREGSEPVPKAVRMDVDEDLKVDSNSATFIIQPDWHTILRLVILMSNYLYTM